MEQKLPVGGSEWVRDVSRIGEDSIKNYNENSDIGYFIKVDIEYSKELHDLHCDLLFLPERMKINKYSKLVCNLYDKKNYFVYIRALKQALMQGLKLKKVHKVLRFYQKPWLKPYIEMNTELRKKAENEKPKENVRKHTDIKLVTTDKRRDNLVSEPNYHAIKCFAENLAAIEMRKAKIKMNKPIYVGMAILDISKTLMYEFWYRHLKPKYGDRIKLCYMDTDSLIPFIKTEDFYEYVADDVEKRFDPSDSKADRPLPTGEKKKLIGLMKDELKGRIMSEFVALRPKTYVYQIDDYNDDEDDDDDDDNDDDNKLKKAKGRKKYVIERLLKFNDYKDCLLNDKGVLKSQQRL